MKYSTCLKNTDLGTYKDLFLNKLLNTFFFKIILKCS